MAGTAQRETPTGPGRVRDMFVSEYDVLRPIVAAAIGSAPAGTAESWQAFGELFQSEQARLEQGTAKGTTATPSLYAAATNLANSVPKGAAADHRAAVAAVVEAFSPAGGESRRAARRGPSRVIPFT
jgi:hypothetical protein